MKRALLVIAVIAIIAVAGLIMYQQQSTSYASSPPEKITFENLESTLPRTTLVQKLPSDSSISLRFYKDSPDQIERSYILTRNSVIEESSDNVDITILVPSKYITELTTANICDIITQAKNSGELTIATDLSTSQLALKFASLWPQKSCFGL